METDHGDMQFAHCSMSKQVNRKMDIALLPFLSLLYLFNGLDRSNVGNAETQGMLDLALLIRNVDHNHVERLHYRYRRYSGRSQPGSLAILHHVCIATAAFSGNWEMAWGETLDHDHHGKPTTSLMRLAF